MEFAQGVSGKLGIRLQSVEAVLQLLGEGSTIPFIARYRKDMTGNMDEVQIQQIQDEAKFQKEFSERKTFIEKTITEQDKMTETLQARLDKASTINELEDIYLPYKPKRKTKAQTARENGLEPLANILLEQKNIDLNAEAANLLSDKVLTIEDALQGARDIIAELVNEDANVRAKMRKLFEDEARLTSKVLAGKETGAIKYKDYFDYSELIMKVPSHRALAVFRGFMEGFLRIGIEPEEEYAIEKIEDQYMPLSPKGEYQPTFKGEYQPTYKGEYQTTYKGEYDPSPCTAHIRKAIKDAYKRLLQPSLESEFRMAIKQKSDEEAINVFAENLRQLLLSSPLGSKRVLAIDPGYRTGCKVVCLDEKGELLKTGLIFPHENNKVVSDGYKIKELVSTYKIEAFAIGDGTAGRETEQFVKKLETGLPVFMVNEDGASVYYASEIAREEFPNEDVTVRGSVSIGRRLMDPLAELVKIDPKAIGVGQYQHDVNQVRLKEKLDQTVVSCVNTVGVNLNTASKHLLSYVSGIGKTIAKNIVDYRNEIGKFSNRNQLKKVPRLGDKAFEQCAGFLRIPHGENALDASAVHPESYTIVKQIAADFGIKTEELIGNEKLLKTVDVKKYSSFGELTVRDIIKELIKPGLDPRSVVQSFEFANIYKIDDVNVGMIVPGIVTNITRFGAFVDIGVKQDGLVHVSEIANKYISDPAEVLKLNMQVMVKVMEVDVVRKRIALSIKQADSEGSGSKVQGISQKAPGSGLKQPALGTQQGFQAKLKEPETMEDALALLKKKFGK